jgi:hypothetical protein
VYRNTYRNRTRHNFLSFAREREPAFNIPAKRRAYLRTRKLPEPPQLAATLSVIVNSKSREPFSQVSFSSPRLFSLPSLGRENFLQNAKLLGYYTCVTRCQKQESAKRTQKPKRPTIKSTSKQKRDSRIFVSWNLLRHRRKHKLLHNNNPTSPPPITRVKHSKTKTNTPMQVHAGKGKKRTPFHGKGRESRAGGTTMQGQNARLHVTLPSFLFPSFFV